MKNIFNKTNAPYLAVDVLATLTLLASGVFAVAPYVGFLAPVAALSVGLPFIIGGAVFSAVAIALSAVVINKNNTISQQEKFESRVAQRKQEEENGRAELKASGLLPDVIALPEISRQENFSNRMAQRKQEEEKERAELKASGSLPDVIALPDKDTKVSNLEEQSAKDEIYEDAVEEQVTKVSSPENQPAKEENGQGWGAYCLDKAKTVAKVVVGGAIFATAAPTLVGTLFTGSSASPAGDMFNSINGTYSRY